MGGVKSTEGLIVVQPHVYKGSVKGLFEMKDILFRINSKGEREKNLQEMIMVLLTEEWPLTAKGITDRINQTLGHKVSCQGVHKAMKKMQLQNVLSKEGNYYRINQEWLYEVKNFSEEMQEKYRQNQIKLKGMP